MMPNPMQQPPQAPQGQDQMSQNPGSKLLALQNILGGIAEISDDEMKPYIEQAMQQIHLSHESSEGDSMGANDTDSAMSGSPSDSGMSDESDMDSGKPGMDITVGVGGPKDDSDSDMDEDKGKPKGFLAILAKKVASKK